MTNNSKETQIYYDKVNRLVRFSYELAVVLLIFNILLIIVSLVGNSIVILLVKVYYQLRVPANYLLASLAAVDFFIALLLQVGNAFTIYRGLTMPHRVPFTSQEVARVIDNIAMFAFYANLATVCLITLDRYIAIALSLRYMLIVTTKRVKIGIGISWLGCAIVTFGISILSPVENTKRTLFPVKLFLTAFFIVVLNVKMLKISSDHSKRIREQYMASRQKVYNIPNERRGIKTVAFISISLLVSYLPLTLCALEKELFSSDQSQSRVNAREACDQVGTLFLLGNSAVNPMLYFFRNKMAREYTYKMIKSIKKFLF